MKAAIYLRVSTDKQTTSAQRQELLEIVNAEGGAVSLNTRM